MPRMSRWWRYSVAGGVGLVVLLAVAGPLFAPHPGEKAVGMPFAQPGGDALLGTDRLGRDVLSHLLTGGTQLLAVSAVIAVAVTVLSAVLGAVAAVRPRAGKVIELCGDLVILLPAVLGILLVLTAWPQGGVTALVAVSLLFGVPYCARIFAASASTIASSGYVESAVASGESLSHLVFREILPNLRRLPRQHHRLPRRLRPRPRQLGDHGPRQCLRAAAEPLGGAGAERCHRHRGGRCEFGGDQWAEESPDRENLGCSRRGRGLEAES